MARRVINYFSTLGARLRATANGPVLTLVAGAFATGAVSAMIFTGGLSEPAKSAPVGQTALTAPQDCEQQTWPYRDQHCRDADQRKLRAVRIVSTDRTQPERVVMAVAPQTNASQPAQTLSVADPYDNTKPDVVALASPNPPLPFVRQPEPGQSQQQSAALDKRASVPVAQPDPLLTRAASSVLPSQGMPSGTAQPAYRLATESLGVQPNKRARAAKRPEFYGERPAPTLGYSGSGMMPVRTYVFPNGSKVTVHHPLKPRKDPSIEADGVVSYAPMHAVGMMREGGQFEE